MLIYGLALVLVIPMAVGLQDFVRNQIVVPLLFIIWFAKLFLKSISQSNLWAIFLLLPLIFFLKSIKRLSTPPHTMEKKPGDVTGKVTIWAERLRNAGKEIHYDRSLKQLLRKLLYSILAYKIGKSPVQIRRSMKSGDLEVPSAIQAYFRDSDDDIPPAHFRSELGSFFRSWTGKGVNPPFKKAAENVVKFLEDLLKVKHDR